MFKLWTVMDFQPAYPFASSNNADVQNLVTNPWIQVPPATMPWTQDKRPDLVRFGESSVDPNSWNFPPQTCRFPKRKSLEEFEIDLKPAKVHVTEEKMADQLRNMHISNTYVNNQGFRDSPDDTNECLLPTLVLSKEVQNLSPFQEPVLPESLLPKYEKPTRALVLWRPPAGSVSSLHISCLKTDSEAEGQVNTVNNNSTASDLNSIYSPTLFPSTSTDMELQFD